MRSCYKPDKILLIKCSVGTNVARRATHLKSEAFQARDEVRRYYSSAVITFSGFPGELDTILPGL